MISEQEVSEFLKMHNYDEKNPAFKSATKFLLILHSRTNLPLEKILDAINDSEAENKLLDIMTKKINLEQQLIVLETYNENSFVAKLVKPFVLSLENILLNKDEKRKELKNLEREIQILTQKQKIREIAQEYDDPEMIEAYLFLTSKNFKS